MPSSVRREVVVGLVIVLGLVVFAAVILAISQESRLFSAKVAFWTRFDNTSGLSTGSPVRLVGVQIGTVDAITFPTDLNENKIKVVLRVDRAFTPRIRKGTMAYLKSLTYLSQDKYIELTPGDPAQPQLVPGDYIEAGMSAWEETLLQSQSIADDVKEITASLKDLLVALNQGQGVLHEMIHNPEFGKQGVDDLQHSLASLRAILEGLEKGRGIAGKVLRDQEFSRQQVDNLGESMVHLRSILARLDDPQGPLARMSAPDGDGAAAIRDARQAAADLRAATDAMAAGQGLLGRLIHDDAYAKGLLEKIDSIAGHADSIMGKIDGGEGSLGGIVNDPAVYEGLKDVVGGIQKSKMGKAFIHHYEKKGAKARDKAADEPPEPPPAP